MSLSKFISDVFYSTSAGLLMGKGIIRSSALVCYLTKLQACVLVLWVSGHTNGAEKSNKKKKNGYRI